MLYFAMIDGEQRGPFELKDLTAAGVRPDTYVWCKGMDDWQKAEDVADICRYYRQTIFDRMHPTPQKATPPQPESWSQNDANDVPLRFRGIFRNSSNIPLFNQEQVDTSVPPTPTLWMAVMMTIFCFPLTGFIAIYYAYKSRKTWMEATRSISRSQQQLYSDEERRQLRADAHDYNRSAKMWIGITFFLGIIFYAAIFHFNL